jgi:hypothetical protein
VIFLSPLIERVRRKYGYKQTSRWVRRAPHLLVIDSLFAQPEFTDNLFVPGSVFLTEIPQVSPAFTYHLEQTPSRMVILFVTLQVFHELIDACGEKGNLNLWRTSIIEVRVILFHDGCFFSLS